MRRRIRRRRDVAEDILDIAAYISRDSMPAALRFMQQAERTVRWLLAHPGAGALRDFDDPRLANIRSWSVKGFRNHVIFYEVESGGIYVLAVVHGARDLPRFLRRRMG